MAILGHRFSTGVRPELAPQGASDQSWLSTGRRTIAAGALAGLGLIALLGEKTVTANVAVGCLVLLAATAVLGFVEAIRAARPALPTTGPLPRNLHGWYLTLGLGSALVGQTWFHFGSVIGGGDIPPPVGTAWLPRVFASWSWTGVDLGAPVTIGQQLPWAALLGGLHAVGGSPELAQRIWYSSLFAAAAIAAMALLRQLGLPPFASLFGACAYVLNGYVLSTANINPVYLAAMVSLAAVPAVLLAAANRRLRVRDAAILLGLSGPLLGYVFQNPPLTGMTLVMALLTPLLARWTLGGEASRRSARALGWGLPLLALTSTYWIIPAIVQFSWVASNQLATVSSWAWTEARATLFNAFWLNTSWTWNFEQYVPFARNYASLPLSALRFGFPLLAFSAFALASPSGRIGGHRVDRLRLGVAAGSLAIILLFLSTGTNPPGNALFDLLYGLPFGWLLREPGRFLMAVALGYAIMSGLAIEALGRAPIADKLATGRYAVWPRRGLGFLALLVLLIIPAYPLVTGAVVPDQRPILPSEHVRVPTYWLGMANFLNESAAPGAILVLPPDDFYQMPYSWGYYGVDGFIPQLISRPVLVPNGQGYAPASQPLLNAVNSTATSIIQHDWPNAESILQVLHTPLVLVRGDIQAPYPNRHIVSPQALSAALLTSPAFELVDREGPLSLFRLKSAVASEIQEASAIATVNVTAPDLRLLSVLPPGAALVTGSPIEGIPSVLQAPPVETWRVVDGGLAATLQEPVGWDYKLVTLGNNVGPNGPSGTEGNSTKTFVRAETAQSVSGRQSMQVTLPARQTVTNGGFVDGLWRSVSDCNAVMGAAAIPHLYAAVLPSGGPGFSAALRLSTDVDTACEFQWLDWHGGPAVISLMARHVRGLAPRICLWEEGPQRCVELPDMKISNGWTEYRAALTPDPGTTGLALHLYADAPGDGKFTTNDYANVKVLELPALPHVALVGSPRSAANANEHLLILHNSFSNLWNGPAGARHVLVDGLLNGWLYDPTAQATLTYAPAAWLEVGWIISTTLFVFLMLAGAVRIWTTLRGRSLASRPDAGGGPTPSR